MKTFSYFFALLLYTFVAGACDTYSDADYTAEYVVEAYLIAGEPLPLVKLSETARIDAPYRFEELAVAGAEVTVSLTGVDGSIEERYRYQASERGVYRPAAAGDIVQGMRRYELEIDIPGHPGQIKAATVVPEDFSIESLAVDTLTYQDEEALLLSVSQSQYPGRPAIYMNKLEAMDTTFALTPFYQGLYEEDEVTKEELIDNSSGITNEANFELISDETLGIIVPWVAVAFYGPNDIVIDAIDDNIYDFLRTQEENGVRPLGERENVIDHVSGGRGIFGSLARARTHIFVTP